MALPAPASRRPRPYAPGVPVPGSRAGLAVVPQLQAPGPVQKSRRGGRSSKKGSWLGSAFRSHPVRMTAALVVVSAVVFGLVLLNIQVAQASFRLADLQRQSAQLETEHRRLRFEVARSESPEKIVEMGRSLGLVAPESEIYIEGPSSR